jgi:hypothetical protein
MQKSETDQFAEVTQVLGSPLVISLPSPVASGKIVTVSISCARHPSDTIRCQAIAAHERVVVSLSLQHLNW